MQRVGKIPEMYELSFHMTRSRKNRSFSQNKYARKMTSMCPKINVFRRILLDFYRKIAGHFPGTKTRIKSEHPENCLQI